MEFGMCSLQYADSKLFMGKTNMSDHNP
jgi:hypothetical protein